MSADAEPLGTDLLQAGHGALARGAWEEARAHFEAACGRDEAPEALEGLGMAAFWLSQAPTALRAREQAFRLYRQRGDRYGAARVATFLAWDSWVFRGEDAVANGWVRRANRLLDGLDPGAEHALVAICEGHLAMMVGNDSAAARSLGARAAALARSLGVIDLEMFAQALEGLALVVEGEVAEGMRRLDEATAAVVAGELTDLDAMTLTCCFLIHACERVRDHDRATQWCDAVKRITTRWSYRAMFAYCRTHYAGVLLWRGAWPEAEAELVAATSDLAATWPAAAAEGILRLAELRRRQGRLEDAAALLRQAESPPLRMEGGRLALLGRAALALDGDDAATAADLAQRFLRGLRAPNRLDRVAGLELLVRAWVALARLDRAAAALAELRAIAAAVGTASLLAAAGYAEGLGAAAAGDHETARARFEDAVDLFERSGAPYEAAQARAELARVLWALGRAAAAEREARAALETFRALGAAAAADHTAALLRPVPAPVPSRAGAAADPAGLTPREVEVLRLVAAGRSNQEIASELVLSVRTVERHLSTIYEKLGARGKVARAAAAAYALSHGLVPLAVT